MCYFVYAHVGKQVVFVCSNTSTVKHMLAFFGNRHLRYDRIVGHVVILPIQDEVVNVVCVELCHVAVQVGPSPKSLRLWYGTAGHEAE